MRGILSILGGRREVKNVKKESAKPTMSKKKRKQVRVKTP
jgi:hypothetical protein